MPRSVGHYLYFQTAWTIAVACLVATVACVFITVEAKGHETLSSISESGARIIIVPMDEHTAIKEAAACQSINRQVIHFLTKNN